MDSLVEAFLKSPHEEDRKKAIGALARTADRESVIALQQLAEIDESLEIRFYARKALAMVKGMRRTRSDDPLLKLIPEKLDEETFQSFSDEEKCQLLKALIGQNRADTLGCLLSLLKTEQNPYVVATLVIAIGTFGTVAECRFLIPCLAHRDARVRANTIEALELIGNLKLFAYIFPLLEDPDNRVRANAARSLKSIEPFTSFRLLQAMISSGKVAFQASAIYVLRCFESDASAALVAPFLDSPHEDLRARSEQTLRLLAEKGIARAVELVENIPLPQAHSEPTPEPEADQGREFESGSLLAEVAGHSDPAQDIYYRLRQAFIMPDPRQRLEEIEKESVHLGEKSVELLMEFLGQETDPMVVGKIYILLGRLYDVRAVPCLLEGLSSQDNRCRANAVEAIGMLGDPESLNYLIPFLEDPHNRVRGNAILALRAADGVDIRASIMSLVEHPEEFYQRTAVYVLAELQRPEYFPILQRMTRAPFPVVRKNAHTAINALIKAGFNVKNENADGEPVSSTEPEFADQIIGMIGGPPGSRIKPSASVRRHSSSEIAHKKAAPDWSVGKIVGIVSVMLVFIVGIVWSIGLYLSYSAEAAAKAAAVEGALSRVRPALEAGREVAEKITPVLAEAEKILAAVARDSQQAIAAQKKLARMKETVDAATSLVNNLTEVMAGFEKTYKRLSDQCLKLIATLQSVRQAPAGQVHPYTGHVDPENVKAELASLASLREELALASSFVAKLPAGIARARSDMPRTGDIEAEQGRFKKLAEVLAVFEKPVVSLTALEKDILSRVENIESAENELVRASPRHAQLVEISQLKDSLYEGRNRLLKTHETMSEKQRDTEKLIADGDVSALLAGVASVVPELENASKTADLLTEVPAMLEQALGNLVRLLVTFHQKAFAEKISVGMEADFTTNWDAVVNKERTKLAELYTAAHPTGRITAEGLSAYAKADIADISDELQALAVLVNNVNSYLSNAGAFIGSAGEKPPVSP